MTRLDTDALEDAVADLHDGLPTWLATPLDEKLALLARMRRRAGQEAQGIVAAGAAAQGLAPDDPWVGDLWVGLIPLVSRIRAFETVLGRVADGREPLPSQAVHTRPDGQVVVDVVPATGSDRLLYGSWGLRAEIWMQPGSTPDDVRAGAARAYRGAGFEDPAVALVLGAGNLAFLPAADALHLLVAEGCVVALKLNPVNSYLRPFFERIFGEFIDRGWVRLVGEDSASGAFLVRHPGVGRVHLTGSAATHDALTWGLGEEAISNRAQGTPLLRKPFTSELGGVNPEIVVPGPWSASDIRLQADRIVFAKLFNGGHHCAATQVLILPAHWPQSDALVQAIGDLMRTLPPRDAFYPDTATRVARAVGAEPGARVLLPPDRRVLVTGLDPSSDSTLFREEVFADVLAVVRLPEPSAGAYLSAATEFANERLAGDLAATILIHPRTAAEAPDALDRAISDLRYGAVGVNEVAGWNAFLGYPTWGGYPGNTPEDVGSGIGAVGNAFLLEDPQKSVVHATFHPRLKPLSTASHRTLATTLRRLLRYTAHDDLMALPGILEAALRG